MRRLPDQGDVKENWGKRGFSCELWVDPPGQVWENFTHNRDELFMLVEGEVELEIEGTTRHPVIGEEVLIPAKARHTLRNTGQKGSRWLYGYKESS